MTQSRGQPKKECTFGASNLEHLYIIIYFGLLFFIYEIVLIHKFISVHLSTATPMKRLLLHFVLNLLVQEVNGGK